MLKRLGSKPRTLEGKWTIGPELGRGAFGVTYEVVSKQDGTPLPWVFHTHLWSQRALITSTGSRAACKRICKARLQQKGQLKQIDAEIIIMHHLIGHPNVVGIKEVYEDADYVYIVMDLCKGGSLYHAIVKTKRYTERMVAAYVRNIIQVLVHCRTMGVVHRDIKPDNFLLCEDSMESPLKVRGSHLIRFGSFYCS